MVSEKFIAYVLLITCLYDFGDMYCDISVIVTEVAIFRPVSPQTQRTHSSLLVPVLIPSPPRLFAPSLSPLPPCPPSLPRPSASLPPLPLPPSLPPSLHHCPPALPSSVQSFLPSLARSLPLSPPSFLPRSLSLPLLFHVPLPMRIMKKCVEKSITSTDTR